MTQVQRAWARAISSIWVYTRLRSLGFKVYRVLPSLVSLGMYLAYQLQNSCLCGVFRTLPMYGVCFVCLSRQSEAYVPKMGRQKSGTNTKPPTATTKCKDPEERTYRMRHCTTNNKFTVDDWSLRDPNKANSRSASSLQRCAPVGQSTLSPDRARSTRLSLCLPIDPATHPK